jgi:hypothetical protein
MAQESKGELDEALKDFLTLFGVEIKPEEWEAAKTEDQGVKEVMWKTQEKLDELNEQAEDILTKTGMTREKMEAYASNRSNFTDEQWEALQRVKAAGENIKKKSSNFLGEENLKKKVEKAKKDQHHRFGKKKNWIPL